MELSRSAIAREEDWGPGKPTPAIAGPLSQHVCARGGQERLGAKKGGLGWKLHANLSLPHVDAFVPCHSRSLPSIYDASHLPSQLGRGLDMRAVDIAWLPAEFSGGQARDGEFRCSSRSCPAMRALSMGNWINKAVRPPRLTALYRHPPLPG